MDNQLFYPHIQWNVFSKFLLRFAIVFLSLLILPILTVISEDLYPWVGSAILHLEEPITVFPNGSGDTTYNYVELLFCFVVGIFGATIWSLFNKKEKGYDTLFHYFLVCCRYYVAASLIGYGYAKVFNGQFGPPTLWKLIQPYGESSPMGLAWTFIGASKAYTMFSGFAELIGGILLLFRRTSIIGALVGFIVMFNVMMMNFCYDIPVKLYSTQLLLLSFIIMYFTGHNLKLVLFKNSPTSSAIYKPSFTKKWLKITRIALKSVVVFYLVVFSCYEQYAAMSEYGALAPKPPLYGIYKPTQFIKNGDTLRIYSDSAEWKHLVVEYPGIAMVRQLNDRRYRLLFKVDTLKKSISTCLETDTLIKYNLAYRVLNDSTLQLNGIFLKDTINYTFGKVNLNSFRLTNRGFHWVNEYPFNK
jgi:uncharacterized membrane protein YphA (DoxX/SURF4 family)